MNTPKKRSPRTIRMNIFLSTRQLRIMTVLADKWGISRAEMIRRALDDYLARHVDEHVVEEEEK